MQSSTDILIVDDSRIFRSLLEEALKGEGDIRVIGSVRNGAKAMEFIESNRPDLVSLDVEMPEMDGLATLDAIQELNARQPQFPEIGVIMLSGATHKGADTTIRALESGAFDFVAKPKGRDVADGIAILRRQLVVKIRHFASRRHKGTRKPAVSEVIPRLTRPQPAESTKLGEIEVILIAVSTGGPKALGAMLPDLSARVDLPILIVQHMPPAFTQSLAKSLDPKCKHKVIEAQDGQTVEPLNVYIAPGGRHMVLRTKGRRKLVTGITDHLPENGCRPSADVLFRSAAACGGRAVTLVLTGMGADGAKALAPLKRAGAHVIAQDEASSVVWGMPGSAVATGHVDDVRPLHEIPDAVAARIEQGVLD